MLNYFYKKQLSALSIYNMEKNYYIKNQLFILIDYIFKKSIFNIKSWITKLYLNIQVTLASITTNNS